MLSSYAVYSAIRLRGFPKHIIDKAHTLQHYIFSYAKQCPSNSPKHHWTAVKKFITAFKLQASEHQLEEKALDVIQLLNTQPFVHQYELWWYIFYIIADIESMDILIKGSEYWVGAPTAHQLSLPGGLDSHNPFEE